MYAGEKLNSITHLVGAVLALIGFGALLAVGMASGKPILLAGFIVFGLSLVVLYSMSALYHSFYPPKIKRIFQKLDHLAIYLLIAGTYTPLMLVSVGGKQGGWVLAFVWGMAVLGILLETLRKTRIEWLQITIYLLMGWSCSLVLPALKAGLGEAGMAWLVAGGLFYTVGVIFYVLDGRKRMPYAHGIWHLFVLAGSMAHFIAVIVYVD